jgi:hypothetical protein
MYPAGRILQVRDDGTGGTAFSPLGERVRHARRASRNGMSPVMPMTAWSA